NYRKVIRDLIQKNAQYRPARGDVQIEVIFDEGQDHYELIYSGWNGPYRIHGSVLHLDIRDGKIWIQHDGTKAGIADELVEAGVSSRAHRAGLQTPGNPAAHGVCQRLNQTRLSNALAEIEHFLAGEATVPVNSRTVPATSASDPPGPAPSLPPPSAQSAATNKDRAGRGRRFRLARLLASRSAAALASCWLA